ncbi:MAG TPA: cyclic nucleotide-binding domain-containing protein [Herpetosiphonaceae bacterium]|nr:cyclic nucleotide-binding domain-containing protein [Herpetosiphonaceae bacterium]
MLADAPTRTSRLAQARAGLAALVHVYPGEEQLVALLLVHSLFVGFARVFSITASDPLFLVSWGSDQLPYLYIGSALTTALAGFLYMQVAAKLPLRTLLVANLGALLVITAAFRILLALDRSRPIILGLAIWSYVLGVLINLEFWSLAGHLLHVRQAKRLFGLIGSGEVLATVAGGLLTPFLVPSIGTANLLVLAAGGILGALVCLLAAVRTSFIREGVEDGAADESAERPPAGALFREPYILLMFAFTSLTWLVYYLIDNAFYDQAMTRYADDAQLASFLGIFSAGAGVCTLLVRTLISGRIIARYGLTVGLLALPALNLLGVMSVAAAGTLVGTGALVFWLATMTKLADKVLGNSIYQTSFLTLYQPLPGSQRVQTRTITESFVEPAAGAIAGITLLVLIKQFALGAVGLAYVALIVLLCTAVVGSLLGRAYLGALTRALTRRKVHAASVTLTDASSVNVLLAAARSPNAGAALYALELLESLDHAALPAALTHALAHPVAEVRHEAISRIERMRLAALLPAVQECLAAEPVMEVRSACVRTVATLATGEAIDGIAAYLEHSQPALRIGAVIGLMRRDDVAGVARAGQTLTKLITSSDPAERELAARAIGAIARPEMGRLLCTLIEDEAVGVRRAAMVSSGALKEPALWPKLIEALVPPTATAAAMGLVAGGDEALPALRAVFDQPAAAQKVLVHVARICGRIGSDEAQRLLLQQLAFPDSEVRTEVLAALKRCGFQAADVMAAAVRTQIIVEFAEVARLVSILNDIAASPTTALLQDSACHQLQQARERLLLLLSFIYNPDAIRRVRDHLHVPSPEKRAYATELLDVLVDYEWRAPVLAVFEELTLEARARRLQTWFPQPRLGLQARLHALAAEDGSEHAWMRACASYLLQTGDPQMRSTIEKVLILKTVSLFAGTPNEVLVELTAVLEEVELSTGQTIFEKGDVGTSMYIIVDGRVRVHDGDWTLNDLGAGEFFGEMAVLNTVPRVASVTAIEPTHLFRLDQDSLYELMGDRPEIARGIIGVLSARLKARVEDVAELHAQVQQLTAQLQAALGATTGHVQSDA